MLVLICCCRGCVVIVRSSVVINAVTIVPLFIAKAVSHCYYFLQLNLFGEHVK